MKVNWDQLAKHCQSGLKPVYFISGDEILLQQEAADAIRQAARQQAFADREVFYAERGMAWENVLSSANNMSLFGDKKLIEIRFSAKPDDTADEYLEHYLQNPSDDTLLLMLAPKLDGSAQKKKWFTACDKVGVLCLLPQMDAQLFKAWFSQRLQHAKLQLEPEAMQVLFERVEGNLLAAQQEIDKLKLLQTQGLISLELVQASVGDSARYNIYELADAALNGEAEKAARILSGLRAEGVAETYLLMPLASAARQLAYLREGLTLGQPLNALFEEAGIWYKRQAIFQKALQRTPLALARYLMSEAAIAEQASKGQHPDQIWDVLLRLTLALAGKRLF